MSFSLEADVAEKLSPKSDRTKKEYTGKLNNLAKMGWADRASLKKHHKDVIAHIESLYGDDEKGRWSKRFYVYAIFWAMDNAYLKKDNWYHKYIGKIPPITDKATGEAWVPLKKFREQQTLPIVVTE